MAVTTAIQTSEPIYFDFALLRKAFLYFAGAMTVMAPFSRDSLVVLACGIVPWILVFLVDRPRMPAIVVDYLLFV